MDNKELDSLLEELITDDDSAVALLANDVQIITTAFNNGRLTESERNELLEDIVELAKVDAKAQQLESKIKMEQIIDLLIALY